MPEQMSLLRGRRYNRLKNPHGGDRRSAGSSRQSDDLNCERLAEDLGVLPATVKRDGQFAAANDRVHVSAMSPGDLREEYELCFPIGHANASDEKVPR